MPCDRKISVGVQNGWNNRQFARWRHFTTTTRILFVFLSYLNLITPARFQNKSSNSHKKAKPWRILVVVVDVIAQMVYKQKTNASSFRVVRGGVNLFSLVTWRITADSDQEPMKTQSKQVLIAGKCGWASQSGAKRFIQSDCVKLKNFKQPQHPVPTININE